MNANELAALLETDSWYKLVSREEVITMLRQQQAEIEALKKLLQHSVGQDCREMRQIQEIENLQTEIEALKEQIEDCTCQGGHSEAYLIAKGRVQKK